MSQLKKLLKIPKEQSLLHVFQDFHCRLTAMVIKTKGDAYFHNGDGK